jgi:hypothetical protein
MPVFQQKARAGKKSDTGGVPKIILACELINASALVKYVL